ncbi:hypothetical protein [Rhodococcus erythropolis]|uniref:hypothetical protein n=1 Tax=Rhodococcus erythropolis TaxID=1833 RepID=UPI0021BE1A00|nr:hypothetical protein [Rhodococcus erythropolis]
MIESVGPQPWQRVKDPHPLPAASKPALLAGHLRDLDDEALGRLIRDHLVPLDSERGYRLRWNSFWTTLGFDSVLRDRATDLINGFLDQAEVALAKNDQDPAQAKRARKFCDRCVGALDRILNRAEEPLAWAGAAAASFNPAARLVIDKLVCAIEKHRADGDDEDLWETLDHIKSDDLGTSAPRFRRSQT